MNKEMYESIVSLINKAKNEFEAFKTRPIRMADDTWEELKRLKLSSGESWNQFIVRLLKYTDPMGNQRFITPSEMKDTKWKDVFKDLEWDLDVKIDAEKYGKVHMKNKKLKKITDLNDQKHTLEARKYKK